MTHLLDGIHVVTLAPNLPGPLAADRLRKLGARVTKIESPAGDPLASAAPSWYAELTAGQDVTVLDLKDADSRTRLDVLLESADLLITAMRPSAVKRLGLDELGATLPRLGHIEIVGYDGESEEVAGHDLNYQAAYGTLTPPSMPTVPVADMLGAERAVTAAVLLLLERAATGRGGRRRVVLDHAAQDAGAAVRHGLMGADAPLGGALPSYRIYRVADGYVALGALESHFAARVADLLGRELTHEGLEEFFGTQTVDDCEHMAAKADIPLTRIAA
ncbi:CoA transferase (plasmid) [Rhodococcus pyridinivorans]|uniref:CoA transferase n=1 Tax=Rhodococcus TaxID=1827 RepID=UPI000EB465B3|nr:MULTISPECIES: CoA transferase [Rhodococcus]MCT7293957.1 CoA transferase [Rhodococcus sp. PAE-6]UVT27788.1 CoA transferase [Rhodococcus pyridinivorans]